MTMNCPDAVPLIPSYLDGELSEAQAAPLRQHLLACQDCRAGAQSEKALKRWFVRKPIVVPQDFAARVARRAFAGDTGKSLELATSIHRVEALGPQQEAPRGELLQFVLRVTAVAAVFLIALAITIRVESLPPGGGLMADDRIERPLEEILEDLEALNRAEEEQGEPMRDARGEKER
jgi:anti-sigma factor RsiW